MAIVIDDKILKAANISEREMLIEIAFMLYEKKVFGLGKAREFCGLNVPEFQTEMAKREISYYSGEMIEKEIADMKSTGELW